MSMVYTKVPSALTVYAPDASEMCAVKILAVKF